MVSLECLLDPGSKVMSVPVSHRISCGGTSWDYSPLVPKGASLPKRLQSHKISALFAIYHGKGVPLVTMSEETAGAVVEVIRRIAGAFDERDLDTVLAAHYQGPECSMIAQGGQRVVGWDAVKTELENRINEYEYSRTTIHQAVVSLIGEVAVVTYEQRTNSRLHDIDFKWVGWVTDVMIQRDGQWLRVHHQASDQSKA